ncbi:MAG TPA: 16S rRNA (cytosine(1402)-N(4))-methyltransferase RsmH [Stellaceae bacterium]|jgi:16S rRNA (cytosine1402-N4)-methyltransferase|nr:16S rRNA (cytosine(1402)-N(4))-methyltransferase RsmH [Stellaceae bacterium]
MTGRRPYPPETAAQAVEPAAIRSAGHIPVLLDPVLAALAPRDDAVYVDATFGGGGYSEALLKAAHCRVFGIDRDPDAMRRGRDLAERYGERLRLLEGRFGDMAQLLAPVNTDPVAGIALDLGVSSTQLDTPERGFSFRFDGPLDMRMSGDGQSAADLVATLSESDLAELIRGLGEERFARRIARAINAARQRRAIQRTTELAEIVRAVVPQSEPGQDPATRTFQALRIAVNDELGELDRGLAAAEQLLMPGGRLAVVSFHSLEDRRVKEFLRRRSDMAPRASRHRPIGTEAPPPSFTLLTRRAVKPSAAEIAHNPRARAARLRAAARTAAAPWPRNGEGHVGGRHRGRRA